MDAKANTPMDLPYYFSSENDDVTNKFVVLEIKLFNWETDPIQF